MLAQWFTTVGALMSVLSVIAVGVAVRRGGWLSEEADQTLLTLIMRLLFPCLIFSAVSSNEALRQPGNLLWAPAVGAGTIAAGLVAGYLVARFGAAASGLETSGQKRTFVLAVAFYNYTFVPIPLIELLFDKPTLGVMFVHNVGAGLVAYTLGISMMSQRRDRRWWTRMLNGPSIATVAALIANWIGLGTFVAERVIFLQKSLTWLGQAAIPMSLLVIGAVTADQFDSNGSEVRRGNTARMIFAACLLRIVILPVLGLAAAVWLPVSQALRQVMVIMAAMPAGTFVIVLARHYGGVPGVALRVALGTSLLSLLTIPAWIALGLRLIGQ